MKYSVVLTVYGISPYLENQLISICEQTIPPSEVIIIEDKSKQSPFSDIAKILDQKGIKYVYIANESNLGPSESFRKGILMSSSEIIYLSDHDDIWANNKVEKTINFHKSYDLVFSNAEVFYEKTDDRHLLYKGDEVFRSFLAIVAKNFLVGATSSINKSEFLDLFKLAKLEPMYDWCMLLYSKTNKKKIKYLDENLTYYRRHQNTFTGNEVNFFKMILYRFQILIFYLQCIKLKQKN